MHGKQVSGSKINMQLCQNALQGVTMIEVVADAEPDKTRESCERRAARVACCAQATGQDGRSAVAQEVLGWGQDRGCDHCEEERWSGHFLESR
jgi:hypothetical protein